MRVPSGGPLPTTIVLATMLLSACTSNGTTSLPAPESRDANGAQSGVSAAPLWQHYSGATPGVSLGGSAMPLSSMRRDTTLPSRVTYISDYFSSTVTILDRRAYLVGIIGGFDRPQGIFVDRNRALWVANTEAQNVLEFSKGSTTPTATLSDPGEFPVDVSVCPDGTVYVSNIISDQSGSGSISVYAAGSTSPTGTLHYPGQGKNYFLTCDAAGNVFTTLIVNPHTPLGAGGVVEYSGGKQSGASLLPLRLQFPGGIKPYGKRNLLVNDQIACTVTEYTEAGTPTGSVVTYGNKSANDWVDIAVTRSGKNVAGADALQVDGTELAFPSGTLVQTYHVPVSSNGNLPTGIAFDPPQKSI